MPRPPIAPTDTVFANGGIKMTLWLIILGGALAGGLLVLHGFSKNKEVSARVLDTYQTLLEHARQRRTDDENHSDEEHDGGPGETEPAADS